MFKKASRLAKESMVFVFGNKGVLKSHLVIIFPIFLLCAIVNHFAVMRDSWGLQAAMLLPMGYLVSCFFLSWHRVSLRGVDEKPHSPFAFDAGAVRFHLFFFAIFAAMGAINYGLKYLDQHPEFIEANLALSLVLIVGAVVPLYFLFRALFFLPAQSVGVTLTTKEVMRASRGQVGPFIIASFFFGLATTIAISVYIVIVAIINMFMLGNQEVSETAAAIMSFVFNIPVYMAMFFYAALEVTAISKLYQHGMQENA